MRTMRTIFTLIFSACFLSSAIVLSATTMSAMTVSAVASERTVEVLLHADSEELGFEAWRAMDGDARTMWHTRWRGVSPPLPHTLHVDLTDEFEISGLTLTPRTDHLNGVIRRFEVFLSNDPAQPGEPVFRGELSSAELPSEQTPQTIRFDAPVKGRYLALKVLSGHGAGSHATLAELEVHSEGVAFRAKIMTSLARQLFAIREELRDYIPAERLDALPELRGEYLRLIRDIRQKARFDRVAHQTFMTESLIFETDRDPADIVLRRTAALLNDLKTLEGAPDFTEEAQRLERLGQETETIPVAQKGERFELFLRLCELRRKIAFSNPLLNDFDQILFIKRHRATYNHMVDQFFGIEAVPGGGLYVLENPFGNAVNMPVARNLLASSVVQSGRLAGQTLDTGAFLSPNISYEADRIAFAYVECVGDTDHRYHTDPSRGHWHEGRAYNIFTVNMDGSDLRQVTDGGWNDFDPCWMPNGRIVFISERRGGYLRCGRVCPNYTLFCMYPDGSQMRCLSYHETNEWNPSITNDGRIIYTRWDYPDRHGTIAKHPWTKTLDGRDPRQVYGNFTPRNLRSDMDLGVRAIPNSPKFLATAAPHHGQAFGSLIIIDPRIPDDDAMAPVRRITPDVDFPESQGGAQVYGTAFPLSEMYYLVAVDFSMSPDIGFEGHSRACVRGDYGIYLVDAFGNKELIYRDPEISSMSPIPVMPRPKPLVMPRMVADIEHQPYVAPMRDRIASLPQGNISIINVHNSLRPFPKDLKATDIRIIQWIPMSVPSGNPPHEIGFREPTSLDSVVLARYVLGTVPIEEDGSANFYVPPRRPLQLQILDADGLAIQSMRASIYLHDGEKLSCNGCHEPTHLAPLQTTIIPRAFLRPPSVMTPSHPDANPFSYPRLIQPIWDKHCVACHTAERERGTLGVPNLAREPITNKWFASYNELVPNFGFYSYGEPLRTTPGKFGARASRLYPLLKGGHQGVQLSREELQRIALWLDCMSIFYGVYEREGGEAQLRGEIVFPTLE